MIGPWPTVGRAARVLNLLNSVSSTGRWRAGSRPGCPRSKSTAVHRCSALELRQRVLPAGLEPATTPFTVEVTVVFAPGTRSEVVLPEIQSAAAGGTRTHIRSACEADFVPCEVAVRHRTGKCVLRRRPRCRTGLSTLMRCGRAANARLRGVHSGWHRGATRNGGCGGTRTPTATPVATALQAAGPTSCPTHPWGDRGLTRERVARAGLEPALLA